MSTLRARPQPIGAQHPASPATRIHDVCLTPTIVTSADTFVAPLRYGASTMRTFRPTLQLGFMAPPQTALVDKFGGLPWGVPSTRWPICRSCGGSMSHLAQLRHHVGRLDLGRDGRVLCVFFCDDAGCEAFDPSSGANACVVFEPEDLGDKPTPQPPPRRNPVRRSEAIVTAWTETDDGIPADRYADFFDDDRAMKLPPEYWRLADGGTRIGGAPCLFVTAHGLPSAPFRFAFQIGEGDTFPGPMPTEVREHCVTQRRANGVHEASVAPPRPIAGAPHVVYEADESSWTAILGEFCTHGPAYVFVREDVDPPKFVVLAQ
ncbi:MAG: hypothetical protein ACHREM_06220 [Polyangiales bacterium]